MKRMLAMTAVAIGYAGLVSAAWAADVGISIQFSQPGAYGRVDIGQFPQPQVIVPQPVVIARPPAAVAPAEPVYLWVPLEHRKHWDRYCGQYHACGVPVYFVNHVWYREHVMANRGRAEERHEGRPEERGREERGPKEHGPKGHEGEEHDRGEHDRGHRD